MSDSSKRERTTRLAMVLLAVQGLEGLALALVWIFGPAETRGEGAAVVTAAIGLFSTIAFCIVGIAGGHVAGDTMRPSGQSMGAFFQRGGGEDGSGGASLDAEVDPDA